MPNKRTMPNKPNNMSATHPKILGILNITTDSFSDGGQFLAPSAALRHAEKLHHDGADIIDIGPASSHPDSQPISAETEIERLAALLSHLPMDKAAVSIDSYQPATQLWAIEQNVGWLNDIHGFAHGEIYDRLKAASCGLFIMHAIQRQGPARRQAAPSGDMLDHIISFFDTRLAALSKASISESRFVLDPGMGFFLGDKPDVSLYILDRLAYLRAYFNLPILISVSRKSFLRHLSGTKPSAPDIASATLMAELWAAAQGVDYIRTHDVAQLKTALTVQTDWQHPPMRQSGHSLSE